MENSTLSFINPQTTWAVIYKRSFGRITFSSLMWFLLTWLFWKSIVGPALALCVIYVLIVHELGHAIAMWMQRIPIQPISFFVMGAAVKPLLPSKNLYDRTVVVLAGPATGLLFLLIVGCWYVMFPSPMLLAVLAIAIGINWINLLPFPPLDGGHVCFAFLRSFWRVSYNVFANIALLVIVTYIVWKIFGTEHNTSPSSATEAKGFTSLFFPHWFDLIALASFVLLSWVVDIANMNILKKCSHDQLTSLAREGFQSPVKQMDKMPVMSHKQLLITFSCYGILFIGYWWIIQLLPTIAEAIKLLR